MSLPSRSALDEALVESVLEDLKASVVPERRERMSGYFPTSMDILGVPVPGIRRALRPVAKAFRVEEPIRVLEAARALLAADVHEARQLAFELIGGRKDVVQALDATTLEDLGRGNDNWASVDAFCVSISGPAWRDGSITDEDVHRWARSPDPWWKRTALVSTVPLNMKSRGGSGDVARTLAVCDVLATDAHPMVAKALSWALRALVPIDEAAVERFLLRHGDGLAPPVRREVRNKLVTGCKNPGR